MLNRSDFPRPEYPRPDLQRGRIEGLDWLNLNGPWDFCFDGDRRGVEERWFDPARHPFSEQIIVPFCWESLAAWGQGDSAGNNNYYATRVFRDPTQVTRANHRSAPRYEVGWYRREIHVPRAAPAWTGKRVILTVGAADFFTDAWCNGQPLGRHEGGLHAVRVRPHRRSGRRRTRYRGPARRGPDGQRRATCRQTMAVVHDDQRRLADDLSSSPATRRASGLSASPRTLRARPRSFEFRV